MRYFTGDIRLELDADACKGCGTCVDVCPHAVFRMEGKKASIADRGACMECGACAKNCRFGAIKAGSGVGCAAAIISGFLKGGEPSCDCGTGGNGKGTPCC